MQVWTSSAHGVDITGRGRVCWLSLIKGDYMDFGSRLKKALGMKGMSQSDLARATGISIMSISRYINTKREPSVEVLRKICRCLGVSSDYLLGIDGDLNSFDKLLTICKTAGLTTEQRMMLVKALSER